MNAGSPAAGARIPAPADLVEVEVVDDEVLLYHPRQTAAVYLNPTAAVVWGLCDGRRTVADIVALLEESYPDADPPVAEGVEAALASLQKDGMIVFR
ncbi:MAG: PqqD family protein [Xanthobacteraceae bacterium]|nr:PqqD family protein [Xanthobacteraceae bacterium]